MKHGGVAVLSILLACGLQARADAQAEVQLAQPEPNAEYIQNPAWAKLPAEMELAPFQPMRAEGHGVTGGAVVDCKARPNGSLFDCRTLKVAPAGWQYEQAAPAAAARLYRLRPQLADGRSVSGLRVLVPVVWKTSEALH